ncbi:MAG: DUF86 domain-containing protein [Candidatus Lokiarchaeota archaeon]|nr:DUF86 domain-containing protein [Candidatus Lokiarchaeota archaeon]MBD3202030.1 DUF86 domain-containing protein [Candidatus Lokiarchaeota archaeon]
MEWKEIAGKRDKLIDHFGVDYELVWDVITTKILKLREEMERLLNKEKNKK